jgi:hypothetical protein
MAHAELDGLGPSDGPVTTWAVPRDFAQGEYSMPRPLGAPRLLGPLPSPNARKLNRLGGEDFLLGGSILITGSC